VVPIQARLARAQRARRRRYRRKHLVPAAQSITALSQEGLKQLLDMAQRVFDPNDKSEGPLPMTDDS
jgi:hypothetical protein